MHDYPHRPTLVRLLRAAVAPSGPLMRCDEHPHGASLTAHLLPRDASSLERALADFQSTDELVQATAVSRFTDEVEAFLHALVKSSSSSPGDEASAPPAPVSRPTDSLVPGPSAIEKSTVELPPPSVPTPTPREEVDLFARRRPGARLG